MDNPKVIYVLRVINTLSWLQYFRLIDSLGLKNDNTTTVFSCKKKKIFIEKSWKLESIL